jgi:hypothetical protein
MSRRLVISILVILIVGILGGTVVFIVQRLRGDEAAPANSTGETGNLDPANEGSPNIVNPNEDADLDGLTTAEESLWRTDPNNADTDGDSYRDGEEVKAEHNPTIAGPDDKLPVGFIPGNFRQLDAAPLQVDQFFSDNLDLSGGKTNLTEQYNKQYSESKRTPDTLRSFVITQPIITRLPTARQEVIKLQETNTPLVMGEYLDVAGDLSVFSAKLAIGKALDELYRNNNPGLILAQAEVVRLHQQNLLEMAVPPAANNLQRLLLGYTELVAATYDLMARYDTDPVKSVLAVFPEVRLMREGSAKSTLSFQERSDGRPTKESMLSSIARTRTISVRGGNHVRECLCTQQIGSALILPRPP